MTPLIAQTIPFADTWSMHDPSGSFGGWLMMTLGTAAFLGAVITVAVWLRREGASTNRPRSEPDELGPREILDRSLADGSFSVEEYERRRELLDVRGDQVPAAREATIVGADR